MKRQYLLTLFLLIPIFLKAQTFEAVNNPVTNVVSGSRAATFVDLDKDGWLDIFITNGPSGGENNMLFMNDGSGEFERNSTDFITRDQSSSDGATWGDIDNDGYEDLYVVCWYDEQNWLYHNRMDEFTLNRAIETNGYSETASWGDYNQDGYLDLYITNSSRSSGGQNEFYKNNGDGSFTQKTDMGITDAVLNSRSVNWIDFDNDDDLDLFVTNEGDANELYINQDGSFTKMSTSAILSTETNSTGSSWADYDNDGDLDLYVANFGEANELYQNQGDGTFVAVTGSAVTSSIDSSFGTAWGDIDNDGDLDLFVANGFKSGEQVSNALYLNNGDGTFTKDDENTAVSETGWSFGVAMGDYDNDGFLDLLVANTFDESQSNSLYHNKGNDNNWVILDLEGTASNRSAIGAKVKVTTTVGETEVTQLREVSSQSGYNGQNSLRVHFGLGAATEIDKVEIIWPNANSEEVNDVTINQIHKVKEAVPTGFLRADFVVTDPIYLTDAEIELKDLTVYPEGETVTYEWDFDNDGEVDSTDPNPTASFSEIGDYSVSLKVTMGNKTSEKVKTGYIRVRATLLSVGRPDIKSSLSIYPNPVMYQMNVNADFLMNDIRILALDGKTVYSKEIRSANQAHIFVGNLGLKAGVYTVMVSGQGQQQHVKLLIEN